MFVGRSNLTSLVEQMVLVDGEPQVPIGAERPVLVVQGYGGSGRTSFTTTLWSRWKKQTPTAWVNPLRVAEPDVMSLRPVLVAVMQGLSDKVAGFDVKFPRVVLAHIAMESPIAQVEPERANEAMRRRLIAYRDRAALITLVGGLVRESVGAVAPDAPGVDVVTDAVTQGIVDGLRRASKLARFTWDESLAWFGHQDNGLSFEPITALVHLSRQAGINQPDVRSDVDDLLVAALLADLRESLGRVAGRPWNALVLLDNGDVPAARSFIAALLRMRASRANRSSDPTATPIDPVVVVATSGGLLATELPGRGDIRQWLPIELGELTAQDVHDLARGHIWPADLGTRRVADAVFRLTGGHAAATDVVLRALQSTPALIDDLDDVLARGGSTTGQTVEQDLLDRTVAGLSRRGETDDVVRDQLVTLAAARHRSEANRLREHLGGLSGVAVTASATLWSGRGPGDQPALPRFIRYVALRSLASRTGDDDRGPDWVSVFTTLRDQAAKDGDRAARLHHELALGNTAVVVDELTEVLPDIGDDEWLRLLDEVTATPDLRASAVRAKATQAAVGSDARTVVHRLVTTLHALSDPRLSERKGLCHRYLLAENDFRTLAGSSEAFLLRAQHYRRLADRLC